MKPVTLLASAAAAMLFATAAGARHGDCFRGGAYSASQDNAYHQPYMANNPGVNIINDESAAEAVAKLRAMNEAGNVTWTSTSSPRMLSASATKVWHLKSIRTPSWRPRRTARRHPKTSATPGLPVLHPADRVLHDLRLPYGCRRMGRQRPASVTSSTRKLSRAVAAWNPLINNMEWALLCDGVGRRRRRS